jgi:hypothetical protein
VSAADTHAIGPQAKLSSIGEDPYFRRLLSLAYKNDAIADELTACVNAWHHRQLEHYRRSPPGVGLPDPRLLELAALARLAAPNDKLIAYGRSVLSAASHHTPLLAAAQRALRAEDAGAASQVSPSMALPSQPQKGGA